MSGGNHRRRSLRRPASTPAAPVSLDPQTAFEAILLERITALRADVAALQDQQKWIIRLLSGIVLGALLNLLLK